MIFPPEVLHLKSKMSKVSARSMNCFSEICSCRQNSLVLGARSLSLKPCDCLMCALRTLTHSSASCAVFALNQNSRLFPLNVSLI